MFTLNQFTPKIDEEGNLLGQPKEAPTYALSARTDIDGLSKPEGTSGPAKAATLSPRKLW